MSTNDVPGAKTQNHDVLAMGCWAEHDDGSMIFVESVEAGTAVYCMFDLSKDPPVEYRDAMPEAGFKDLFTWKPEADDTDDASIKWTWHDKTPMPWDRVMSQFTPGVKYASAEQQLTAAERVARSLDLRAQAVRQRDIQKPTLQRAANTIMTGIKEVIGALRP